MKKLLTSITMTTLFLTAGCVYDPVTGESRMTNAGAGATFGAASGAILGSMTNSAGGTLIGAGIGAIAGSMIGDSVDRQEAMLRSRLHSSGVRIIRSSNDIRLVMPSDITFANNSATINPHFYRILNSVSYALRRFDHTTIRVAGHTSSTGNPMHNQILSEHRATAVAEFLNSHGVDPNRIFAIGYGDRYPIAPNTNTDGRAVNRRVEITIHPIG